MTRREYRGPRCTACGHTGQLTDGYCGSCLAPPLAVPDDPTPTRPPAAPAPRRARVAIPAWLAVESRASARARIDRARAEGAP